MNFCLLFSGLQEPLLNSDDESFFYFDETAINQKLILILMATGFNQTKNRQQGRGPSTSAAEAEGEAKDLSSRRGSSDPRPLTPPGIRIRTKAVG
jgi:hypothetical protein